MNNETNYPARHKIGDEVTVTCFKENFGLSDITGSKIVVDSIVFTDQKVLYNLFVECSDGCIFWFKEVDSYFVKSIPTQVKA